jgi:hypothetical protein
MWVSYSNVYGPSVDLNDALKKIKLTMDTDHISKFVCAAAGTYLLRGKQD